MITADTPITDRHRRQRAAEALASEIMRDAHPRSGLVTFFALGQHQLLTAIILHTAHTHPNTPLKSVAKLVTERRPAGLGSDMGNSPCGEASGLWHRTLDTRKKETEDALVFNIAFQLVAIERRAAA